MASNNRAPEYFVGLMSGTSLDAMDGVLADMSASPPQMLASVSVPFFAEVRERLLKLNKRQTCDLEELAWLESQISEMATQAVLALLKQSNTKSEDVRAIGYPGQTIAHNPEKHRDDANRGPEYFDRDDEHYGCYGFSPARYGGGRRGGAPGIGGFIRNILRMPIRTAVSSIWAEYLT